MTMSKKNENVKNVTVNNDNRKDVDTMDFTTMTKKEKFEYILTIAEIASNEVLTEFIDNEIALLTKKADYKKSHQTKKQVENATLTEKLLEVLPTDKFLSIEEIKQIDEFGDLSTPKISALIRPLREKGLVVRDFDKKHAIYKKVGEVANQ